MTTLASPTTAPNGQDDNLRIAAILHYVLGAFKALIALSVALYVMVMGGITAVVGSTVDAKDAGATILPLAIMGGLGIVLFVVFALMAAALFYAGACLNRGTRRTYCIIVAAFVCLSFPLGTALGVFTLYALLSKQA